MCLLCTRLAERRLPPGKKLRFSPGRQSSTTPLLYRRAQNTDQELRLATGSAHLSRTKVGTCGILRKIHTNLSSGFNLRSGGGRPGINAGFSRGPTNGSVAGAASVYNLRLPTEGLRQGHGPVASARFWAQSFCRLLLSTMGSCQWRSQPS